jgi:DNA primase
MPGGWQHTLRQNPVPGDIVACLQELDLQVYKVDRAEAQAQCPAHFERTGKENSRGDWSVNIDDGMHNCFSCGFKGAFVEVVIEVLSCTREEAVSWVRERGGIERVRKVLGGGSEYENQVAEKVDESDLALFIDVPEDVCETRDIDPGAADDYRVLWDPERKLWITCIREFETDRLIGWQAKNRRFFNNHPEHMEKGDHVYGINDVPDDCNTGIIVESPLDCSYILSADVEGAVSTMGAGITDRQLDILVARFDVLISALDNDESGDKTNRDLRKRVGGRANLRFWNYGRTDAKDPGEQTYREIRESYKTAYSAILARF